MKVWVNNCWLIEKKKKSRDKRFYKTFVKVTVNFKKFNK